MVDGFDCLRHNAVVRSNYQDGNICNIGTACTHRSKCFVSRCIQEGNLLAVVGNLVSTDVLRDAACFACGNMRMPNAVQNGSLTVVNVTHDNNNRAAFLGILCGILLINQTFFNGNDHFFFYLCAQFLGNKGSGIKVDFLVDGCHNAQHHQLFDDFRCCYLQPACQFADNDVIRNQNLQLLLSSTLQLQTAQLILLGFPLVGIFLLVALCRLLIDLLLFGGIIILILISRCNLLIPLIVLIQIYIRTSGIYCPALFCFYAVRRSHGNFHMQPFSVLLCLWRLLLRFLIPLFCFFCRFLFRRFLFRLCHRILLRYCFLFRCGSLRL